MTQYESIYDLKEKISAKSQDLDLSEQSIRKQIHLLTKFLENQGFVNTDDENVSLTTYGKIMAQVNECNPMILGYMLQEKIFSGLTFDEIVALLSIFIDDRSLEPESIGNLPISDMVKDRMYCIGDIVNRFADDEVELSNNLPYPVVSDWYLHTNMLAAVKEWAKGKTWKEIYHLYPTFEGNFIKNVLRLTNLIKNVYLIAKITKDSELLNTMEEFESKMIRGFVTTDSLYI
jgi:superfamily II RNA helicase